MKIFILNKYICLNPAILYVLGIKNQSTFVKPSEIMINYLLTRKPPWITIRWIKLDKMTENGLIWLETVDTMPKAQQIQFLYKIYAILHSFYNKKTIFNFFEKWSKNPGNREMSFIFCQTCLYVDRLLKKMNMYYKSQNRTRKRTNFWTTLTTALLTAQPIREQMLVHTHRMMKTWGYNGFCNSILQIYNPAIFYYLLAV